MSTPIDETINDYSGILFLIAVCAAVFVLLAKAKDKFTLRKPVQEIWARIRPKLPVEKPSRPDPRTEVYNRGRSLVADNEYMLLAGSQPDPRIGWSRGDVFEGVSR